MTEHDKGLLAKMSVEADKKARARDLEAEKEKPSILLTEIAEREKKINKVGMRVIRLRDVSRVPFAQTVVSNLLYLVEKKYITTTEHGVLNILTSLVELNSNAIMQKEAINGIYTSTGKYANVTYLATLCGKSRQQMTKIINSLISKGIINEWLNGKHKRQLKQTGSVREERPLYLNPEIIIAADKNHIGATLCRLVINDDVLEGNGIKLPFKIWMDPDAKYGKLVMRNTYLKHKKAIKRS